MRETILGIDPGSTTIGYGVIGIKNNNSNPFTISYGYIDLKGNESQEKKLIRLYKDMNELITQFKPSSMAIESIYFFKNAKTFSMVLQSRGIILLAAAEKKIHINEYTPLQVKQTISGYGKASKVLIQKLVKSSLSIESTIRPDDASDALAIALCHHRSIIRTASSNGSVH